MTEAGQEIPENVPVIGSAPPRKDLINTAVKFLQNPKVQSSPLQQKKEFLKRKGLTDEEINLAVEQSGIVENQQAVLPANTPQHQTIVPAQALEKVSTWNRIRDYSALAVIVGGVLYGLYSLFKNYIEPIFLKRHEEQEKKLGRLEEGVQDINTELRKSMQDLQSVIGDLRSQLADQTVKISQVSNNLALYKAETTNSGLSNSAIGELRAEITSVKGLLLSTKQFPAAPVNPPVIPSWQLKSAERSPASSDQKAGGGDSAPAAADDAACPAEANSRDQAIPAQRRIDLEENDANVDGESEPRGAADHGSAESISTVNGHQNGYASVEGDAAPSSIGSSLHDAMLVSPGKLAALNSASQDGKAPIVSGESELD